MHDAPPAAAVSAPRDRRMDIAALCEPAGGSAFALDVPAQLHHSRPLHRVEQDRILDRHHHFRHHHHHHHHPYDAASNFVKAAPAALAHRRLPSIIGHRGDSPIAVLSAVALAGSDFRASSPSTRRLLPPIAPPPPPSTSPQSATDLRLVVKPPVAPSKKRLRRMTNSERGKLYRSRRKSYVEALEGEVQELQQEMQGLQLYGSILQETALHSPHMTGGAYSRVVSEYFAVFASGIPLDPKECTELSLVRPTPRQSVFMSTLLDAKMEFCGGGGPSRLMGNWKAFSLYHSSLRYTLQQLQVVLQEPTAVVTADAALHVRLTRATVEHMFPHVLWNEALVQRLVGREVVYHVHNVFYFGESGKVVRYESHVDFLGAFMAALGSLADAMELAGPISERQQREQFGESADDSSSSNSSRSGCCAADAIEDDDDPDATE